MFDFGDLANGGGLFYGNFPLSTSGLFTVRPAVQAPATSATAYLVDFVANMVAAPGWDEENDTLTGTVARQHPDLDDHWR